MAGVVLETLSWRKLSILVVLLFLGQFICFLIGGLIAPTPTTHSSILTEKCIDRKKNNYVWFHSRMVGNERTCTEVIHDHYYEHKYAEVFQNLTAEQLVFMAHIPLPRSGTYFNMSRWFQHIIGVLHTDIMYKQKYPMPQEIELTMNVRLGYRNKGDNNWTELASSIEKRPLKCSLDEKQKDRERKGESVSGHYYDCEILPLFSLGSCYYDEYLVNIRFPSQKQSLNLHLGELRDVWVTEIHQNGGFTIVWFTMKTLMFPLTLAALVFFSRRINMLPRKVNLLEQTIISLGIFMSILNFPVEWLSLRYNFSFWLVLSDIRQGAFYAMLLCFWIVFTGEHMLDDPSAHGNVSTKERFYHYWPQLVPVGSASIFLFLFELAERGVQLNNPFYSVWSHKSTARVAVAFIGLAGVCAPLYLGFLTYKICIVIRQMWNKRAILPTLPDIRQRLYRGIIYRFTIFIGYTLLCAVMTIIFFLISQIDESQWKWGEKRLEYTSAYITGVYGMWNFYVISILCLYAPSHKYRKAGVASDVDNLLAASSSGPNGSHQTRSDDVVVRYQVHSNNDESVSLGNRSAAVLRSEQRKQRDTEKSAAATLNVISGTENITSSNVVNPLETLVYLNKPQSH